MIDNAVYSFGTALTNALQEVEGKTSKEVKRKQEKVLRKWLPDSAPAQKFRDPAKVLGNG